jgi:hypothetical protein
MTSTFSFSRLLQLIRKQWFENSRMYLFATLALLSLQALVFGLWLVSNHPSYSEDFIYAVFLCGLYLTGAIFASISFSMLGDKTKGSYWLGFPASHFEKLLCVILYSAVFFTIVYCATFYLVKTAAVAYIHQKVNSYPEIFSYQPLKNKPEFMEAFTYFMYGFFAVQALFLLGSVYFTRYSFIVTTIIGTAVLFLFFYYMVKLPDALLPAGHRWRLIDADFFSDDNTHMKRYSLPSFFSNTLIVLMKFMWAPVFWTVTWYRLKEKQL